MKPISSIIFILALAVLFVACGEKKEDEEDCPAFLSFQLYPETGGPDTHFELIVILKGKSVNQDIELIRADLYMSSGEATGKAYDLVRSDIDAFRYLRQFNGIDICKSDEPYCNLFFRIIATHEDGCIKGFDTDMIQIDNELETPDDDLNDDVNDDADDDVNDDMNDDADDDVNDDVNDDVDDDVNDDVNDDTSDDVH